MPDTIRVIAIAAIIHDGKLFVFEGNDPVKDEIFYRPPGGGIDFSESGENAVKREFTEELGASLINVSYLTTIENIFTYLGQPHHEIVMLYKADFDDRSFYEDKDFSAREDDGSPFRCLWIPINQFVSKKRMLYPPGLTDIINTI